MFWFQIFLGQIIRNATPGDSGCWHPTTEVQSADKATQTETVSSQLNRVTSIFTEATPTAGQVMQGATETTCAYTKSDSTDTRGYKKNYNRWTIERDASDYNEFEGCYDQSQDDDICDQMLQGIWMTCASGGTHSGRIACGYCYAGSSHKGGLQIVGDREEDHTYERVRERYSYILPNGWYNDLSSWTDKTRAGARRLRKARANRCQAKYRRKRLCANVSTEVLALGRDDGTF